MTSPPASSSKDVSVYLSFGKNPKADAEKLKGVGIYSSPLCLTDTTNTDCASKKTCNCFYKTDSYKT